MRKFAMLATLALAASAVAQTAIPEGVARVHYQRADGNYTGWGLHVWEDTTENVAWDKPLAASGKDADSVFFDVKLKPNAKALGLIVHKGDDKDPGADLWADLSKGRELWIKSGSTLVSYAKGAAGVDATKKPEAQTVAQAAPAASAAASTATQTPVKEGFARIYYFRPDGNYDGWGLHAWEDITVSVDWAKPLTPTGKNESGVYWDVPLKDAAKKVGFIVHKGDDKDPGADLFIDLSKGREVYVTSGKAEFAYQNPRPSAPAVPANAVRVNYFRPDGNYTGWGLHAWEDTTAQVEWTKPLNPTGTTDFGVYWDVPMKTDWAKLGFLIHKGDDKDPGPDMFVNKADGNQVWIVSGQSTIYKQRPDTSVRTVGDLTKMQAIWVSRDTLAVKPELLANGALVNLYYAPAAGLKLTPTGVTGGQSVPLLPVDGGLTAAQRARFPHLAGYAAVRVRSEDAAKLPEILRSQTAVSSTGLDDKLVDVTGTQIAGALDDLYFYGGQLGATWQGNVPSLRLWAPTAQSVKLHLFDAATGGTARVTDMRRDGGTWTITGANDWKGKYYLYEVNVYSPYTQKVERNLVTDPYSVALSLNSARSQLVNLSDAAFKPNGWDALKKPELRSVSDLTLYELHVRDFSAIDTTVPANQRGTYLAFTQQGANGMKHLKALAQAGLKAVHLLPTFDIATIEENKANWKSPGDLAKLPANSDAQQAAANAVRDQDAFNWGYDPYHYNVPEGSYAVNPDQRTLEYRTMVAALNGAGLRVVQDVVYNHTNASGQADRSVLDKIVPSYYQRLNLNGVVENSTCCSNTASENRMMEKLMVDSVVFWAKSYKIDGFRFDLMGHHMVSNMQAVRRALDALTLDKDGVDGKKIYVYGEGWDFGEVQGGKRGANATQVRLFGQGIGTFNDRIRDAIRGGSPFGGLQEQGFATGLVTIPNGQAANTDRTRLARLTDWIKIGLTGNLRDYRLVNGQGQTVTGGQIDYNGAPAGYAASPRESINYSSAHDNQTLFDAILLKAPANATTAQRVRMNDLAMSVVAFGQGIPFFHAGEEMLRSKSFDTDSYNSGDWFNAIDWTGKDNGFGRGLPPAEKNGSNWDLYRPLLGNAALKPTVADVTRATDHMREILGIRASSSLFRMETAQQVQQGLTFLNNGPSATPGLIVMRLTGQTSATNPYRNVLVVFNAGAAAVNFSDASLRDLNLELHPIFAKSTDAIVKQSRFANGTASVPGLTTAVFVGR
ncbi:pullulanase-type alpha-1,6-glucosidase [Deinococcus yavapaiensis]|uniref:Pullulanase n=1 Tax=Deinococcus yavapaiensis KR-236 TaxID=694435 RepID=A0A318S8Z9_9DEIO|nr:pullulanase-type alpha-1,6-glucosidase [Deinococcus yavapaiensis]PYE55681.1 pullulanase [Deinococcus yavapaiensis KR-236]